MDIYLEVMEIEDDIAEIYKKWGNKASMPGDVREQIDSLKRRLVELYKTGLSQDE